MLARPNRLTRGADYKAVVRRGRRSAGAHTITYVRTTGESDAVRFGFIVSKQVGGAVVRNTVRRRLKAVSAASLANSLFDVGTDVVIRALPSAATAPYVELREDVTRSLSRVRA